MLSRIESAIWSCRTEERRRVGKVRVRADPSLSMRKEDGTTMPGSNQKLEMTLAGSAVPFSREDHYRCGEPIALSN